MKFVQWNDDLTIADFYPGDMVILNWLMRPEGTLQELADVLEADEFTVSQRVEEIRSLLHKTIKTTKNAEIKRGRLLEPLFRALDAKHHKYVKKKVTDKFGGKVTDSFDDIETDNHEIQLKAFMILATLLGPAMKKAAIKETAGKYNMSEKELAAAPTVPQLPPENDNFLDDLNETFQGRRPKEVVAIDVTQGQGGV